MKYLNTKRITGFTLIETLIVIAICGIVASVVLPAYHSYVSRARFNEVLAVMENIKSIPAEERPNYLASLSPEKGITSETVHASYHVASTHYFYYNHSDTTDDSTPTNPYSDTDKIIDKLPVAKAYFGIPPDMNIYENTEVYIFLNFGDISNAKDVVPNLREEETESIKAAHKTQVILSSADFDIVESSPAIQAIKGSSYTVWSWIVTPKDSGIRNLIFTVSAVLDLAGKDTPTSLETYKKSIEVTITDTQKWWRFAKENLSWIWAPILGFFGFLSFVVKWLIKRLTSDSAN